MNSMAGDNLFRVFLISERPQYTFLHPLDVYIMNLLCALIRYGFLMARVLALTVWFNRKGTRPP